MLQSRSCVPAGCESILHFHFHGGCCFFLLGVPYPRLQQVLLCNSTHIFRLALHQPCSFKLFSAVTTRVAVGCIMSLKHNRDMIYLAATTATEAACSGRNQQGEIEFGAYLCDNCRQQATTAFQTEAARYSENGTNVAVCPQANRSCVYAPR